MFDLVGVVVHFGNCENGHYYSYIRKRPCPEGDPTSTWLNFNDADVEPFDSTEIPDRAFGGTSDDGYTRTYKLYSAYMLFYQRRSAIEKDQRQWAVSSQEREPKVAIPRHLEDEINARNTEFIREYCLFDSNHSAFVRKLHAASRTITYGTCSENHEQVSTS
jgi:ubiquitin carboxyl-terminal hydrolase 34